VKSAQIIVALLLALPVAAPASRAAHAAAAANRAPAFDRSMAGRVFATALAFATPRTLDAATPEQLTEWGLQGINALDESLRVERQGKFIRLFNGDRLLASRIAPAEDDSSGWGRLAAEFNAAAFAGSAVLRRAEAPALVQSFFDEMFNHLDPYSRYVPPAPAASVRDRLSLDAGPGMRLVRRGGFVVVATVVPAGPGDVAGIRVGDRLLSVDGRGVRGLNVGQVTNLLTGAAGEERRLRVRGLDGIVRTVPMTLDYVPPETVFAHRDGGVLTLRVTEFDGNTALRLSQEIEAGMAAAPRPGAVVVDLRGNRGGLLRQAVTAVALFAEQGVIASTAGRDPQATHDWRIEDGGDLTHGARLLVLVDGRTASAAEIMAAALADLGRAVVIGSTTFGKGLVQTITSLPDGGELYITWSRVLAPKSWPIQTLGVMPQLCTSRGEAEQNRELDELAAGRAPLAAAIAKTRAARAPLPAAQAQELRLPCPAADGSDRDVVAAMYLANHPAAYQAALLQ
jgi:carboxyl-terminal processing protease